MKAARIVARANAAAQGLDLVDRIDIGAHDGRILRQRHGPLQMQPSLTAPAAAIGNQSKLQVREAEDQDGNKAPSSASGAGSRRACRSRSPQAPPHGRRLRTPPPAVRNPPTSSPLPRGRSASGRPAPAALLSTGGNCRRASIRATRATARSCAGCGPRRWPEGARIRPGARPWDRPARRRLRPAGRAGSRAIEDPGRWQAQAGFPRTGTRRSCRG